MIKNKNYLQKILKNQVFLMFIESLQNLWKYKNFLDSLAFKNESCKANIQK